MKKMSSSAEEILESLWIATVEKGEIGFLVSNCKLSLDEQQQGIDELVKRAFIEVKGDRLYLRKEGRPDAQMTVRRHRLAERLMMDILDIQGEKGNEQACEFEHLLHEGVDTKICTLLNHPTTCPHGNPIPPGACCEAARQEGLPGIVPLTELKSGESGEIAYLAASDGKKMQKLMCMGVLPGSELQLMQSFPSYIFKVGHSQFAVDDILAREIHIRRSGK